MKVFFPIQKAWLRLCFFLIAMLSVIHVAQAANIDSLELSLKGAKDIKSKITILNQLGWEYSYSDPKKALNCCKEASLLSKKENYSAGWETAMKNSAQANLMMGNYDEALKLDKELIAIHEKNKNIRELGKIHNNISIVYNRKGEYQEAMNHLFLSKKCFEALKDTDLVAMMYVNIGNSYNRLRKSEKALECFVKAVQMKPRGNDSQSILGEAYVCIGITYLDMKKYILAGDYFKLAEKTYGKDTNPFRMADLFANIASVYMAANENETAGKYLRRALHIYKKLGDPEGTATVLVSLASISFNQGFDLEGKPEQKPLLRKAIVLFDSSLAITSKYSIKNLQSEIYLRESDAFELLHRYDSALMYYEKHIGLRDTLQSKELEMKISEMSMKYETEKREKDIALLEKNNAEVMAVNQKQKNTIILVISGTLVLVLLFVIVLIRNKNRKRQQEIKFAMNKTELEQKALRAQMNPHFLFNSLNSIQRMFVEGKTDAANEVMADFSSLLRRILNNSGKTRINLKEEIETLQLYLDIEKIRCDNCFEYLIQIDDSIDKLQSFVPPLVIQPFVENAIWHGVLPIRKQGRIVVSIHFAETYDTLLCTVEDNGSGIDTGKISTHGSKGIQITEQRLGTKVVFERPPAGGTRVKIIIPLI